MKRRELNLLIILIVMAIGVAFYQFVYTPKQAEIIELKSQKDLNNNKLEKLKAKQGEAEKNVLLMSNIDKQIKDIEKHIPYIKDTPAILVDVYNLLNENGLEGTDILFGSLNEGAVYNYFNVSFEVEGDNEDVYKFLQQIESFKREVSIDKIDFTSKTGNLLKIKLALKVFLMKSKVLIKEPFRYDFMEGLYGKNTTFSEIFKQYASSKDDDAVTVDKNATPGNDENQEGATVDTANGNNEGQVNESTDQNQGTASGQDATNNGDGNGSGLQDSPAEGGGSNP